MTFEVFQATVACCEFPDYSFVCMHKAAEFYIFSEYDEADTVTGRIEIQKTREWVLDSRTVTRSEVVATCFKCIITSMEHKAREWFTYCDKPIYQPHHDVDALLSITTKR